MDDPRPFNGCTSDLQRGITLVEASAGTGKTFSIAMLVLRAVVELGVPIEKILVVTFTIAATEELKERVRSRLSEARTLLKRLSNDDLRVDDELGRWARSLPDRVLALKRLEHALIDIDQAAIHTIHGFCQKILREQVLQSGHLFDVDLIPDVSMIVMQAVQDYWRVRMYTIDSAMGRLAIGAFGSPDGMYSSIKGAERESAVLVPRSFDVDRTISRIWGAWNVFSEWFRKQGAGLQVQVAERMSSGQFKAKFSACFHELYRDLESRVETDALPSIAEVTWLDRQQMLTSLDGRRVRTPEDKESVINEIPLPGNILENYRAAVADLLLGLRLELAQTLRDQLPGRLKMLNVLSFDDLVHSLAQAVLGAAGKELCRQVGSRYQVALIDEFQDTDQAQWQIFAGLFDTNNHYLYLIGDPKQAIYRFRGADIQSYFTARSSAHMHYTLGRNYRSCPGLMAAVNDLLHGAVIAGDIYRPIQAAKSDDDARLIEDTRTPENIIYCQLEQSEAGDGRWSATEAGSHIRNWIIGEISSLITAGSMTRIEHREPDGSIVTKRVKPADIAILVRTNTQAEEYREDLRRVGVPAVMASKLPVFATRECSDLGMVLQAIHSPADIRLLRAALTCDWFGLSGDEHVSICSDDRLLSHWQDKIQSYYELWQQAGFLPMFNQFLEKERVYLKLGCLPGAERRITNIGHLAELVQETELNNGYRISQTIQWLREAADGASLTDEVELRLESDADGVTIRTMHGAKGLEFPIVFCPSLQSTSYMRGDDTIIFSHDSEGRRICDLGSPEFDQNRLAALEEERDEDMRLAYVSITRATLRSYLFWADIKQWRERPSSFSSPLGILLFPQGGTDFDGQRRSLLEQAERNHGGYRMVKTTRIAGRYIADKTAHEILSPRARSERILLTPRTRTSFSGLARLTSHEEIRGGAFDESDVLPLIQDNGTEPSGDQKSHTLPGGVRFGNIVHDILERIDFKEIADRSYDRNLLISLGQHYNLDFPPADLEELLQTTVQAELLDDSRGDMFSLADLEKHLLVKEMEFTLTLARTRTEEINELLGADPACAVLSAKTIEGHITGYIDLICTFNGRYYVIDYKTNHLGTRMENYAPDMLLQAMRAHNYGLQYWLYTLVVHRHLRRWQPAYSYAEHFGGVIYLFVRGMSKDKPGSGVFFTRPDESVLNRLDETLGGGAHV